MTPTTVALSDVGAADVALVGGKGANLGELASAGFPVPPGFCVTTAAYDRVVAPAVDEVRALLDGVGPDDPDGLRSAAARVRALLSELPRPLDVEAAITAAARDLDVERGLAVRSSATAEDLPQASFAGQQDTFLNVVDERALLDAVTGCWVSSFTDRAVTYRARQGIDHANVSVAVVVQQLVHPSASGILFTADPVTGHRHVASIDAGPGLGEAFVAGVVTADLFRVDKRTLRITDRTVGTKRFTIEATPGGGTRRVPVPADDRDRPAIDDRWVRRLVRLGGAVEAHFGVPQDVEWAIVDGAPVVLQSRPITTLFPVPDGAPTDDGVHVHLSVSHFQVMIDPIPPLGTSVIRTLMPFDHRGDRESHTITEAGGRLYLDITPALLHPLLGRMLRRVLPYADERFAAPVAELAGRSEVQDGRALRLRGLAPTVVPVAARALSTLVAGPTQGVTDDVDAIIDEEVAIARARLDGAPDLAGRLRVADAVIAGALRPVRHWAPALVAGVLASRLVPVALGGRGDDADLVAAERGLRGNVGTDMSLAVGDLADVARDDPALVALLERTDLDAAERLAAAAATPAGGRFLTAWRRFLDRYGARGPAEIDLSRPRWREDPSSLLQMVVNDLGRPRAGAHRDRFERLRAAGEEAVERLVRAAGAGLPGRPRAVVVRRLLRVSRDLVPLREHHKFLVVRLLATVKPTLLEAGDELARRGVIEAADDVWFLRLSEVLVATGAVPGPAPAVAPLVATRRAAFEHAASLVPPRVITSDGEVPAARIDTGADAGGGLVGTAASAGVVEGPARVVLDPAASRLRPGEILVAPHTDPGWTPLFVTAAGLVTEVGGLMTHGSVVAREYGIPAVVGVDRATEVIATGQRIRVDGHAGRVEVLEDGPTQDTTDGGGPA